MLALVGTLVEWVPENALIAAGGDVGAFAAESGSGGQTRALGKRLTRNDIMK